MHAALVLRALDFCLVILGELYRYRYTNNHLKALVEGFCSSRLLVARTAGSTRKTVEDQSPDKRLLSPVRSQMTWVRGPFRVWASGLQGFRVLGLQNSGVLKFLHLKFSNIRVLGFLAFRVLGFKSFRVLAL